MLEKLADKFERKVLIIMMLKTLSSRGFYFWFAFCKVICMNSSPVPSVIPCPIPNFPVLFYLYGMVLSRAKKFCQLHKPCSNAQSSCFG